MRTTDLTVRTQGTVARCSAVTTRGREYMLEYWLSDDDMVWGDGSKTIDKSKVRVFREHAKANGMEVR